MRTSEGKQKGIRSILMERGLFSGRMQQKEARKLLSQQDDFREQKTLLEETVSARGHEIIFYPKFHPEFNFIEMYWGACKASARKNCDYSWKALQALVPRALDSVNISTIRRFAGNPTGTLTPTARRRWKSPDNRSSRACSKEI